MLYRSVALGNAFPDAAPCQDSDIVGFSVDSIVGRGTGIADFVEGLFHDQEQEDGELRARLGLDDVPR